MTGVSGLNQRGVIHLVPLLLILAGIIGGVYLVQKEGFQIFKPKAGGGGPVQWIQSQGDPENCIISVDGQTATANCSKIKLRLNPPDPNQTSDASFQLVKTAYASHGPDTEDWYCGGNNAVYHSEKYQKNTWEWFFDLIAPVNHVLVRDCDKEKDSKGRNKVCKEIKLPPNNSAEDVGCFAKDEEPKQPADKGSAGKSGSAAQYLPPVNISPEGEVEISSDPNIGVVRFYWAGSAGTDKYTFRLDSPDQTTNITSPAIDHKSNNGKNVSGGAYSAPGSWFKEGVTYTWWVDAFDKDGKFIGTSKGSQFTIKKVAEKELTKDGKTARWTCGEDNKVYRVYKDGTRVHDDPSLDCDSGGRECEEYHNPALTKDDYPNIESGLNDARCVDKTSGAPAGPSRGIGATSPGSAAGTGGQTDDRGRTPAAGGQTAPAAPGAQTTPAQPATPAQPGGGTPADCTRGSSPTDNRGYLDPTQAECVLRDKSDLAVQYIKWGWCSDDANRQAIANDWYSKLATDAEKQEVSAKCLGAPAKGSRKVVKYRLAVSSPLLLDKEEWKNITSEPIALNLPGLTTGRQSIFVQFQDDKGQTVKVNGLDWATAYVVFTTPTIVPEKDQPAVPDSAAKEGCPVENYRSYSIEVLIQKCSSRQLSGLPVEVLRQFSNQDLLTIAKALNGENGPFYFLSQFDADRLGSFDLGTLKKLPEGTINSLPDSLKNLIKGGGGGTGAGSGAASSEQASCSSVSVSSSYVTVNFSGKVSSLKIWLAANSEVDKAASAVGSWSQVKSVTSPVSGSFHTIETAGFTKGTHAVLVSLHGSAGQMLDGNPNGTVNSACASSMVIP